MQRSLSATTYRPWNKFFEANRRIVAYEIRPHNTVTFWSEVDLTEVDEVRRAADRQRSSYTAFVTKALAIALREFPCANRRVCRRPWLPFSRWRLQQFHQSDISIARELGVSDAEGMAFVDVLRDADQLSLAEITDWLGKLGTCDEQTNKQWRAFNGVISSLPCWLSALLIRLPYFFPKLWVEYRGGAALISSPAKYGVDGIVASWSWPIGVSFGLVKERPRVRAGEITSCPTFMLTMNFDRRIMAGAPAARFFNRLVELLENAQSELATAAPPCVSPSESVTHGESSCLGRCGA